MLVLTRQRGESIFIGDVKVTVVKFMDDAVRLVISAPRDIPIQCQEVYEAGQRENLGLTNPACDDSGMTAGLSDDQGCEGRESRQSSLSVSRRYGETVMIGDDVALTVVDIHWDVRGDQVRLGIAAPRDIPIHREEVREAILRQEQHPKSHLNPTGSTDPSASKS